MSPLTIALDDLDRRLLQVVQEEFPITERPYQALGELLGASEHELITRSRRLRELGIIRRIGPIIDMKELGFDGVLVALSVPEKRLDEVAFIVNGYGEVSHNYLRPNETEYNLWFTLSARMERIREILDEIEKKTGLKQLILPTQRIFKIGVKFNI
jgi:DNA-binding Lrp family transcriptional regulator